MKKWKVNALIFLWIISYLIVLIFSVPLPALDAAKLAVILTAVYFLPLMYAIHQIAKKAERKKTARASRMVFLFLCIWECFAVLCYFMEFLFV